MGTMTKYTQLLALGLTAHIDEHGEETAFYVQADTLGKLVRPVSLDADETNGLLVAFLRPVHFAIGAGTYSVVRDTAFAQCLCQAVKEYGLSRVGWTANNNGGQKVNHF